MTDALWSIAAGMALAVAALLIAWQMTATAARRDACEQMGGIVVHHRCVGETRGNH